ncbi:MAG: hypothetical protein ACI8X5_000264 [Planctomycetota bacterium]|jgi:hypothetical protein
MNPDNNAMPERIGDYRITGELGHIKYRQVGDLASAT